MSQDISTIQQPRNYLPTDLAINTWEDIAPYYQELIDRELTTLADVKKWLKDRNELEAVLSEELGWRYIRNNCYTNNQEYTDAYQNFVNNILPHVSKFANKLDKKLLDCPYTNELTEKKYQILLRGIKKRFEIFREANIPVFTEIQNKEQEYGKIVGAMTIEHAGTELTLQQAANYLKKPDRALRQEIYKKIQNRRLQDKDALNDLLRELIDKRHQVATNADFENYRDYRFAELGRFDYTPNDCYQFHQSIKEEVCPLVEDLQQRRKVKLGVDKLRPWDLIVDPDVKPPLKPFSDINELIDKTISSFSGIRSTYGEFIRIMKDNGYLDLASRKGKAPGGFNYPLHESNVPFIFMNATHDMRDLETMMHEGGHAVHAFLASNLELADFKEVPSEVAELASMSMELISMDQWDQFFDDHEELRRAKRNQLESVLSVFPWVATIDKFQQWLYTNPHHTPQEKEDQWHAIHAEFAGNITDWSGLETYRKNLWQKQLHIFEVPLYYIEYAIAQLGAIAIWRNYKQDPAQALDHYEKALSMGYTATIPEIYQTAGIQFNFSRNYVHDLMQFVKHELDHL